MFATCTESARICQKGGGNRTHTAAAPGATQVVELLESLELGHLSEPFKENGVDGAMLVGLSDSELSSDLGMKPLQVSLLSKLEISVTGEG